MVAIYFGAIALHEPSLNASECWSFPDYDWVIYAPCLLSLALNFVFLIDIIRVLWLKLRARHAQEPSQYRSVKSEYIHWYAMHIGIWCEHTSVSSSAPAKARVCSVHDMPVQPVAYSMPGNILYLHISAK